MKKLFGNFVWLAVGGLGLFGAGFAGNYAEPQWQAVVHNEGLNFQAKYQDGKVVMSWNKFVPTASAWQYYKVVRSTSLAKPYYPDHGYIQAIGDQSATSYVDTQAPQGTVYYGVCAITTSSAGKWRNCDWQAVQVSASSTNETVAVDAPSSTTIMQAPELSDAMKAAVDAMVARFQVKLNEKFGDDVTGKKVFLAGLLPVVDNVIATASASNKSMFQYLKIKIVEYQGIVELESLLNID